MSTFPTLYHYSDKPMRLNFHRQYSQVGEYELLKPEGLWLSYDDNQLGWKDWCTLEEFRIGALKCRHRATIREGSNILQIRDVNDAVALTQKYLTMTERGYHYVDWQKVARDYQGISLFNYRQDLGVPQDGFLWYYTIDCQSACIWDLSAISSFRFMKG